MFFRKKYTKPIPPWLTLGAIAFLALAFLTNQLQPKPEGEQNWNFLSMENYKSRVLPGYGRLEIKEIKEGTGPGAVCGQEITITIRPLDLVEGFQTPTYIEPVSRVFVLGGHDAPEAVQEGVLGMRLENIRELKIPPERSPSGKPERYQVRLLAALPAITEPARDDMPLKILDKTVGTLQAARCGDTVTARITLWDEAGRKFFTTSQPLSITLGQTPLPIGIIQGIIGMQRGGNRTIILPPALQQPLHPEDKPVIPVADKPMNLLIADVELLP